MKTKINLIKIGLLISISSIFYLISSCSLIGFGIGAGVDKKKPKTNSIYKNQINTLELGSNVEIILNDRNKKYGKYGGILYEYDSGGIQEYQMIKEALADEVILPNQNDTLMIYLSNEKNTGKLGLFKGFESGKLWYKYFYSEDFSSVELSLVDNFTVNYENNVDSVQINNILIKQKFPNLLHLKVNTKPETIEYIPLVAISKIEVTNKRNAKFIGLGVGIAIDAIITAAAIKSMQNMSFEMSF